MKTDPVCGQTIDPLRARAVAIVAGERYYFCCAEHRAEFAAAPARFVAALRPDVVADEPAPEPVLAEGSPAPRAPNPPRTEDLVRFEIGGMTGPDDAERVRRAIARVPGVTDVEIDLITEVATLAVAREAFAPPALVEAVATAGYEAAPRARSPRADLDAVAARVERLRRPAIAAFAAAAVLAALPLPGWAAAALALVVGALAGRAAPRGLPELVLAAGALGLLAAAVGVGDGRLAGAVLALVGLVLARRTLEEQARHATGAAIAALPALPESRLAPGDLVRIAAPEVVPVDGVVRSGAATIDESALAGARVAREAGDPVLAGTALVDGAVIVEVRRAGRERTLARVRAAVVELQGSSAPLGRLGARAAALAPLAAATAAAVVLGLELALGRGLGDAVAAAAGALAAISPLAAALAVPTALAVATARAAGRGVLFRNAEAFERARDVSHVVVDKNAILMQGRRDLPLNEGERSAARFVSELRALGIRVALVTRDDRATADRLARVIGFDDVYANLSSDEKKRAIVGLSAAGRAVAVVGDGIDDAAALAAADVGIALDRGADVTLAAAAVTVVRGDLDGVLAALAGARRGVRVMRTNLALALGHAALVPAALVLLPLGSAAPMVAAAAMTVALWAIVRSARRA